MDITYFFKGKLAREEASSAFLATLLSQTEDDGIFKANFFKLLGENYDFGEPIPTEIIKKISSDKYKIITEEDEIDITMQGNNNLILIENKVKVASKTPNQMKIYYKKQKYKHKSKNIIFIYLAPTKLTAKSEIDKLNLRADDYAMPMNWEQVFDLIENNKKLKDNKFCSSGKEEIRDLLKTGGKYEKTPNRMKLKKINKSVLSKLEDEYKKEIGFYSWTGENATEMNIFASNTNLTHNNQLKYNCDDKGDPLIYDPKSEKKIKLEIRLSFKISDYGKKNKHMKDKWDEINEENIYVISKNIYKRNIERSYELIKEFYGTEEELKKSMFKQSVIILDHFKEYLPATICINDKCPRIGKKKRHLELLNVRKKTNEEIWKCEKCEEERTFRIPTKSIKQKEVCTQCRRSY